MSCSERERLFEAVSAAITEHHQRLSRLQRASAIQNHSILTAANAELAESFGAAREAWTAYLDHIREHGCSVSRDDSPEFQWQAEAKAIFTGA
jgi:hypothetical protein